DLLANVLLTCPGKQSSTADSGDVRLRSGVRNVVRIVRTLVTISVGALVSGASHYRYSFRGQLNQCSVLRLNGCFTLITLVLPVRDTEHLCRLIVGDLSQRVEKGDLKGVDAVFIDQDLMDVWVNRNHHVDIEHR